jgi:hypothetical protein
MRGGEVGGDLVLIPEFASGGIITIFDIFAFGNRVYICHEDRKNKININ